MKIKLLNLALWYNILWQIEYKIVGELIIYNCILAESSIQKFKNEKEQLL